MVLHLWIAFALAYLLTTLTPGPNVLLIVGNALRYGPAAMPATFVGNLAAQLAVTTAVAVGLGAMLVAMPSAFSLLKLVGAGYLIYLGARQLFARAAAPVPLTAMPAAARQAPWRIAAQAFLVSGSNPKTLLFLCAFLPQFLEHGRPLLGQFLAMYVTIAAIVLVVHSTYCYVALRFSQRLRARRWAAVFKRAAGALFMGMGVRLLATRTF